MSRMKRSSVAVMIAVMALVLGLSGCSRKAEQAAAPAGAPAPAPAKAEVVIPPEFSADITMKSEVGTMQGRIFVSKEKSRVEFAEAITVNRPDKGVVWMILPATKSYFEQPIDVEQAAIFSDKAKADAGVTKTLMGEEDVGGRKAQKYRVTINGNGEDFAMLQWVDKETGVPVKSASEDGRWSYEYVNLKVGPQTAELFELPVGYNKMAMPQMQ